MSFLERSLGKMVARRARRRELVLNKARVILGWTSLQVLGSGSRTHEREGAT